jgi:hypothetical protein
MNKLKYVVHWLISFTLPDQKIVKIPNNFQFCEIYGSRKGKTTIYFFPSSFLKKSGFGMKNKRPGSATLQLDKFSKFVNRKHLLLGVTDLERQDLYIQSFSFKTLKLDPKQRMIRIRHTFS